MQFDLEALAKQIRYVGSGEHKRYPNPLCKPDLRTDNSDCDAVDASLSQDSERLNRILREAIRRGQIDRKCEGAFPRHVWGQIVIADGSEQAFEARLTNQTSGEYKGYFITDEDLTGKLAWVAPMLAEGGAWATPLR